MTANDAGRRSITNDVADTDSANTDCSINGASTKPPMYAAPENSAASIEVVKFLRRKNSSGSRGNATRASTNANETSPTTPIASAAPMTPSSPRSGAWLSANISDPVATASVTAPGTSKPTSVRSVVSRSTRYAATTGMTDSAAWIPNIGRHPRASISGPPITNPIAGEPAATSDHQPMALARSPRAYTLLISAIEDGIVAPPIITAKPRSAISEIGSQARVVTAVMAVETAKPVRKTRRWP